MVEQVMFSIIIPTKNEERRLPLCLQAIKSLSEEQSRIEIIVVDNGSRDKTVEIAKGFGTRIASAPRASISELRNIGASMAHGEVLAFVDADVLVGKDFLSAGLRHLYRDPVGIVTGPIGLPLESTWVEDAWAMDRETGKVTCKIRWSSSMNMIVRRDLFLKVGGFSKNMETCEDVEFSYKISKIGKEIIYDYRVKVVHIGEAKTLGELFRKERWRGSSALRLFVNNCDDIYRWLSIGQIVFFMLSIAALIFSVFKGDLVLVSGCLLCIVLLPALRALVISGKAGQYNKIHHLFIVWLVYYVGRVTVLFYDNLLHGGIKKSGASM